MRFCGRKVWIVLCAAAIVGLADHHAMAGIVSGQTDTFQDGTLANWLGGGGGGSSALNIATGGPAGAGDRYLQLAAGTGIANRLLGTNSGASSQWTDNWTAAGITSIEMDLMTASTVESPMPIRIAVRNSTSGSAAGYVSTSPFMLTTDGLWHHAVFQLNASSMTGVAGTPALTTFANDLANVQDFRILNATTAVPSGDAYTTPTASFGVDNITAVPEPTGLALFAVAGASLFILNRRRFV
jgi:hypothetical protein